jgi:Rab-like protein 5
MKVVIRQFFRNRKQEGTISFREGDSAAAAQIQKLVKSGVRIGCIQIEFGNRSVRRPQISQIEFGNRRQSWTQEMGEIKRAWIGFAAEDESEIIAARVVWNIREPLRIDLELHRASELFNAISGLIKADLQTIGPEPKLKVIFFFRKTFSNSFNYSSLDRSVERVIHESPGLVPRSFHFTFSVVYGSYPFIFLMQGDLKVIVVGPSTSGKTEIADILSAASKGFQGNCKPTVALSVLEFTTMIAVGGLQTTISVQLWDSSGDAKYQMGWPAIAKNADGVILVYNAHDKASSRALETYAKTFTQDLNAAQVLVAANRIGAAEGKPSRPKLTRQLEEAKLVLLNVKEGLDEFTDAFATFLGNVYQAKLARVEAAEQRMVGAPSGEPKPPKSGRTPKKQQQQIPNVMDAVLKPDGEAEEAPPDSLPE